MAKYNNIQLGQEEIKLSDKELMFCEHYLSDSDRNATQAAISAGYSKKTARTIATQNLSKLHIQKYLEFKTKPILEKYGITQERVIQELAKIAFSDVTSYLEDDYSVKDNDKLTDFQRGALSQIKVSKEKSEHGGTDTTVEFKTWSKDKALILAAELTGLINRKGEVQTQTNVQNNYYGATNDHIKNQ